MLSSTSFLVKRWALFLFSSLSYWCIWCIHGVASYRSRFPYSCSFMYLYSNVKIKSCCLLGSTCEGTEAVMKSASNVAGVLLSLICPGRKVSQQRCHCQCPGLCFFLHPLFPLYRIRIGFDVQLTNKMKKTTQRDTRFPSLVTTFREVGINSRLSEAFSDILL